jgi:2-succinyl-6-hydroxy-2,4-cyclohexadiene-1-carboxylate synthase
MSGRPVLATLHGFTGSPASWRRVCDRGGERLRGAVHLALYGHSRSLPPGTITSFDDEADRVARELAHCSDEAVILAGYSLGARIALVTALRHPRRVARLVLVSGRPGLRSTKERAERRAADEGWIRLLKGAGLEAFVDQWEALPLWNTQQTLPIELAAAQRRERLGHDPAALAAALATLGLAEMPDCWPRLAELTIPVDLVVGELDETFTAIAEEMLGILPHASLQRVAGSGHNPLLEHPAEMAGILGEAVRVS